MTKGFFKNLIYGLSIIWGVASLTFFLFYAFPDTEDMLSGQRGDAQTKENIKKELGLNLPIGTQYKQYLHRLSPIGYNYSTDRAYFDTKIIIKIGKLSLKYPEFGTSYLYKKKVSTILSEALTGTLFLAGLAMLISFILGIFLGTVAALKQNHWLDSSILSLSTIGISVPSFFSAMLISWLFGYVLQEYTGLEMTGSLKEIDLETGKTSYAFRNSLLPILALAIRPIAVITQLMRSSLLQVLSKDYIRTAAAKGLSPHNIIIKHALKNALNPVITAASGWFASLMAGAFFVEYIFNWKGMGKVIIEAVQMGDLPVVSAGVLYIAFLFIVVQFSVDKLYKLLDPRIQ
jgi:peptide/nickel transport system permease protein